MAASEVPAGFKLRPIGGEARTVEEWMITFQMLAVVLDPYTYESSWALETAGRFLEHFRGASVRGSFVVTCDEDDAKAFLGPWTSKVLTYLDPDREFVRACGLTSLPALVHVHQDRHIEAVAEGWEPLEWRAIGHTVARERNWTRPTVPAPGDPEPFPGSPALPD